MLHPLKLRKLLRILYLMNRWSQQHFFWERAPFFRLLLALVLGILCYEWWQIGWVATRHWISLGLLLVSSVTAFLWIKKSQFIGKLFQSIALFIALSCLGYLAAGMADIKNQTNWYGHHLKEATGSLIRIIDLPDEKERTWKLNVTIEGLIINNKLVPTTGNAFVYIYKQDSLPPPKLGEVLMLSALWQPITNMGNPYEFDYRKFCERKNIYYQQFINSKEYLLIEKGALHQLSASAKAHQWGMEAIAHYVKDASTLGLLQAMLLGDEINFSAEDRQLYVDTGIIHIVAISGGHIAFLMLLITSALFWIRKKKHQWIKLAIALPMVIFYVMVAGAPPSAVRAAVVFSLLAIGVIIGKSHTALNTLLAATFFILLVQPMWLFAVGFQLSVVAVLSLIIFYKPILNWYQPPNKFLKFIWSSIAASLAAEILIAPLVVYYFHLLPAMFLVANVVAVMLMGIVMSLGISIMAFSAIPFLASLLASIVTGIVTVFQWILYHISLMNPEFLKYLHLTWVELLLCYFIIASIMVFLVYHSLRSLQLGLIATCILLLSFNIKQWNTYNLHQFIVYNVSKQTHAEYLSGGFYTNLSKGIDTVTTSQLQYATKENHIINRAWQEQTKRTGQEIFSIRNKTILFLKEVITDSITTLPPIDYLVIHYPLQKFDATALQHKITFRQLIITGKQRRKQVEAWKDSCAKKQIPAHFTLIDGAYIANLP